MHHLGFRDLAKAEDGEEFRRECQNEGFMSAELPRSFLYRLDDSLAHAHSPVGSANRDRDNLDRGRFGIAKFRVDLERRTTDHLRVYFRNGETVDLC